MVLAIVRRLFFLNYSEATSSQVLLLVFLGIPCAMVCAGAAIVRIRADVEGSPWWTAVPLGFFLCVAVAVTAL